MINQGVGRMKKSHFVIIYLVILLFFLAVLLVLGKKQGMGLSMDFDERQRQARGKAFQYAFFGMLFYEVMNIILSCGFDMEWCDSETNSILAISIGVTTFASVSIWKDAFIAFRDNKFRNGLIMLITAVGNMSAGILHVAEEGITIVDGKVEGLSINLIFGVVFTWILLVWILKIFMERIEER